MFQLTDNLFSSDKTSTLEFRSPNGTLNKVIWQNNVNFFTKLLLSCASSNFDNDFDKYCFLRQYYKDFNSNDKKEGYPLIKSLSFWK